MLILSGGSPQYEGGRIEIIATAPIINNVTTMINSITFTIDGRPLIEMNGLNGSVFIWRIRNVNASLDRNRVSCTAALSIGVMLSCTTLTLQIQGKSHY